MRKAKQRQQHQKQQKQWQRRYTPKGQALGSTPPTPQLIQKPLVLEVRHVRELAGTVMKLARAQKHMTELKEEILAFFASKPFSVVREVEAATGDIVHKVRIKQEVPTEFAAIIGDVIHNLRTALDYLAWQMVVVNGGIPSRDTGFPITKDAASFQTDLGKKLKGASPKALRFVQRLRPYQGGDDVLWMLHSLDITDKHKLILSVGAANRAVGFKPTTRGSWPKWMLEMMETTLTLRGDTFPLEGNTVLSRHYHSEVQDEEDEESVTWEATRWVFEVFFSADQYPAGVPVYDTLEGQVQRVTRIIELVDRFIL